MANEEKKVPFDPKVFLATVNGGRSISKYRTNQKVFAQGKPADAVFYIQKGKVKITVVSEQGKEAVVAVLGPDASKRRARAKRFSLELNSWSTKSASTRIVRAKRLASVTGKRSSASARTIWGGPMNNTSIQN